MKMKKCLQEREKSKGNEKKDIVQRCRKKERRKRINEKEEREQKRKKERSQ